MAIPNAYKVIPRLIFRNVAFPRRKAGPDDEVAFGFGKIPGIVQILVRNRSSDWRRLHSYRENMSSAPS